MKKKRMLFLRVMALMLLSIILMLDIAFFVVRDKDFSDTENRKLQMMPEISVHTLASGRFESAFETYVADQFPMRNAWIRLNALINRFLGRREINGVFLGSDGYLIQNFVMPGTQAYSEQMTAIRAFSNRHPELKQYMLLVPSARSICADLLPAHAVAGNEDAYISSIARNLEGYPLEFVDVRSTLQSLRASQQVYYRTDHHWTTDAAYAAYLQLAQAMGLEGGARIYDRWLVSDNFCGTLTAMSGCRMNETDEIYVYQPQQEELQYCVHYVEENERSASFYNVGKLDLRDQYALFFGGNHAVVEIESTLDSKRTLLVLKDSYANCFVPFLTPDFKKVIMVDPRYYTDDVEMLIQTEGVSDVLFLYNANTLSADTALKADLQA